MADDEQRYTLELRRAAVRALAETLPLPAAFAVERFLEGPMLDNPRRVGKELRPPFEGMHAARVGAFRILYTIDERRHRVVVKAIRPRSDAYRA